MRTRVVIVDDNQRIIDDLLDGLADTETLEIVGVGNNGQEAVEWVRRTRPEVVLMDLEMPVMDGIEATRIIREQISETEVLIWTVLEQSPALFRAYEAGARGYLMKNASNSEIEARIRATAQGEATIPPTMMTALRDEFERTRRQQRSLHEIYALLTPRESEVLRHIGRGEKNREIAQSLFITEEAVKKHLRSVFEKLNVSNRIEAAAIAQKIGLT